ncbi:MAG: sugar ABC transporter permease [Ruminococcaceae bacterium]|nr:sugar ABC transporter permease [Oscillospiraceae bacterium]
MSGFFKKYGMSYFFLSFWLVLFMFFTVIPIICAVVLSFTDFDMVRTPDFVGIQNYLTLLLDDEIFMKSLSNTVFYALITGPAGYLLSFVVAWLITETSKGVRSFLTLVFYAPSLAGNIYMIWGYLFSGDAYGMVNSFLMEWGFISQPVQWLTDPEYNSIAVVIVILWTSLGAGFLSFVAGFQQLNKELFEAGAIDGIRNRWQELWHITLPQMVPQLLIGAVLSISGAFAIGYQNAQLTGNPSTDYSTHTILLHMTDYGYTRFEMGYASTIAVILFVLMTVAWWLISKGLKSFSSE